MSERLNKDDIEFDILTDVLETLRFKGVIFFRSELAAPWGISFIDDQIPRFHIALSGNFFISTNNENTLKAQEMDIVMLPQGSSHWIADKPGRNLIPSNQETSQCELSNPKFQKGKITNRLMCGLIKFEPGTNHPILDSLPSILHFPECKPEDPIWITVRLIDLEMERTKNQNTPIINRLTEVLFMKLLYSYINKDNEELIGFVAAMRNPRIHQTLKLIHKEPDFNWSISSLGERVGMSRATLNRHFQDTLGMAPMTYITNWRIMKAHNLIKFSNATLEQIAETVGFASSRTLNKAYHRHFGYTPNEIRKKHDK